MAFPSGSATWTPNPDSPGLPRAPPSMWISSRTGSGRLGRDGGFLEVEDPLARLALDDLVVLADIGEHLRPHSDVATGASLVASAGHRDAAPHLRHPVVSLHRVGRDVLRRGISLGDGAVPVPRHLVLLRREGRAPGVELPFARADILLLLAHDALVGVDVLHREEDLLLDLADLRPHVLDLVHDGAVLLVGFHVAALIVVLGDLPFEILELALVIAPAFLRFRDARPGARDQCGRGALLFVDGLDF